MKNQMKEYEKFIQAELKQGNHSASLLQFHEEMVRCFQHERFVHLIITLFFVICALAVIAVSAFFISELGAEWLVMWPLYALALIVTVLAVAYIKYYYFLENHTQDLYKITAKLAGFPEALQGKTKKSAKTSQK